MSVRTLLKQHPERFVSHVKIWTDKRNVIEATASHDRLIGRVLAALCSMSEPSTDEEREALQRLHDVLYPGNRP
jgi:hypothetical protein